jgi:hypothetical protein
MDADRVFAIRFVQLSNLIAARQPEELVDLPLILRQLVVDGSPLIHQVNRERRIKVRFVVGLSVRERVDEIVSLGLPVLDTYLLAMLPPNEPKREVTLEQLLAHEVVKIRDNYYSAHQLLDACANKLGGVHYDLKGHVDAVVRDLQDLGSFLEQQGLGATFGVLLLLARVAYTGLIPLYEAVSKT